MRIGSDFKPDWVSTPGDSIVDLMLRRAMSMSDFATGVGLSAQRARALISGSTPIDSEIAIRLEALFGASRDFWKRRQINYDLAISNSSRVAEEAVLEGLPLAEIGKLGWLNEFPGKTDTEKCLQFFGVQDAIGLRTKVLSLSGAAAYRTSQTFASTPGAVATWLRMAEIQASQIACATWSAVKFRKAVERARELCRKKAPSMFIGDLVQACSGAGVAVVVLRAPKDCKASGATLIKSDGRAIMVISHRHKTDDHFWFSFFHEAGHILLHRNQKLIVEYDGLIEEIEKEANEFAANLILPYECLMSLEGLRHTSTNVIRAAREIGISPGMLVGQLQHRGLLPRNRLNGLKRTFEWD